MLVKDKDMAKRHNEESKAKTAPVSTPEPVAAPKPTASAEHAAFMEKVNSLGITLLPEKFRSLGLNVTVNVPTSVTDFDALAEKPGECLAQGVKNIVYRGALATFRNALCEAVEAKTGIARKFEPELDADGTEKKDTDGNVVIKKWEAEAVYIKRVAGDNPEQYQALADDISSTLTFDPTAPEPKAPTSKKLAAVYLTTAQQIADRDGSVEKVMASLETNLGLIAPTRDVAGLAALIKEDQRRKAAAKAAAMATEYSS